MSYQQLQPNFAEVELGNNKIEVFKAEYSKDFFDECIKDNNRDFYFHREGDSVYALPEKDALPRPLGFEISTIEFNTFPYLISKILSIALKRIFESHGRKVYKQKYSSTSIFTIDKEGTFKIGALELVPKCIFSVHPISRSTKIIYLITLSKEYKPNFHIDIGEIGRTGIDMRDIETKADRIIPSRSNIKKYLDRSRLQGKYDTEFERISSKSMEFEFIKNTFAYLNLNKVELGFGGLTIEKVDFLSLPNMDFEANQIKKPIHYYYNNHTTSGYIHSAISQLKPLSFDIFCGRAINLCVFIPNSEAKQCERAVDDLCTNLRNIFHIPKINLKKYYVDSDRREHKTIISKFGDKEFDLAIVFLYTRDKQQPKAKSAYNRLKAQLISKKIPSQTFLVENARQNNQYTLRNLALNIYAKMGGTPWSIEKEDAIENEYVIGIGSTIDESGVRNIGFANVFDYQGSYIVGSCSPLCKIQDYRRHLKNYISTLIQDIIVAKGIVKDEKIRLIFHIFKDASRRYELAAINECLEEYVDYQIEFAIVNVSYNHPFKLFKDIEQQVDRGTYISLNENLALLSMGGKGRKPLQIRLDRRSTYIDLFELSKQILFFSHLSHRTFFPGNSPVTVVYPQRLARLTSDLLSIPHWDIDSLQGMKDQLWFI